MISVRKTSIWGTMHGNFEGINPFIPPLGTLLSNSRIDNRRSQVGDGRRDGFPFLLWWTMSRGNQQAKTRSIWNQLFLLGHIAVLRMYVRRCGPLLQTEYSVVYRSVCLSVSHDREPCKKTAEPIEGIWTRAGWRKHALDRVHTGATWRIRLNRPCAAAM